MSDLTEQQIHELPDFTTLGDCILAIDEDCRGMETPEQFEAYIMRTIHQQALNHFSGHRTLDIADGMIPPPLIQIFHKALVILWNDGFLTGTRYQQRRMNEIAEVVIPDSLEGLE